MFRIMFIFVIWIGWFGHHPIRGKSTAPSIIPMVDNIKSVDNMPRKKTLAEIKTAFKNVWGNRFDYNLITEEIYVNTTTKVPIICKKHGVFLQTPHDHLLYCGCKSCSYASRNNGGIPRKWSRKKIYGIGINDSDFSTSVKGERHKSYVIWKAMFQRCYSSKNIGTPYENCTVCDSWRYFSNFERWFDENYVEGYHLDKDILIKGNKVYSPKTCCFVPSEINTLITKHDATRGNFPIGVVKRNKRKSFSAIVRKYGEYINLGTFDTQEKAFQAYKKTKEAHIQEMATQYYKDGKINEKVYNALMNYKVEITD